MKGHIVEEFGSKASGGASWRHEAPEPAVARGTCRAASAASAASNVRILEQLAPVPGAPPGHMKGHILEEFGSGASEARGTCRGT